MNKQIKVLIVDDSPLFAEVISTVLETDPLIRIAGIATDGHQAVEMAKRLQPQLITMDIQMPRMNGLEAIEQIMADCPTPVLVVTADPRAQGEEMHFEALRRGALDVMAKPEMELGSSTAGAELCAHVKLLASVSVVRHRRRRLTDYSVAVHVRSDRPANKPPPQQAPRVPSQVPPVRKAAAPQLVAIVASTGGPAALAQILEKLPPEFPVPIVVVQHIAEGFTSSLASWLNQVSALEVQLAEEGQQPHPGSLTLAPDGYQLRIGPGGRITLDQGAPVDGHRPSGNLLLESAARVHGARAIGVILTGMGADGARGLAALQQAGGTTIAQDEQSSVVYGMPQVAYESKAAQLSLDLDGIAHTLCKLTGVTLRLAPDELHLPSR